MFPDIDVSPTTTDTLTIIFILKNVKNTLVIIFVTRFPRPILKA